MAGVLRCCILFGMKALRAAILRFDEEGHVLYESDGALVLSADAQGRQRVLDVGPATDVLRRHSNAPVQSLPGRLLAPGFVDMHVHYPQVDVIGSPASGLLPWLENYTFPQEARFADPLHAQAVADVFLDELLRNGVTTALAFSTSHPQSAQALFEAAQARRLRLITGKCLMDRHAPYGVRDDTEQSLIDTEMLISRWHGVDRLGYAITPRFAPSCSDAQMQGASELAARHPSVWIQSHVAENLDEIAWVRQLYPQARSYLDVYRRFGLLRSRAVYAHCIHFDQADRELMRSSGAAAAVSPTSNLFLGSGFFDFEAAERVGFLHGLASDVGGGTSFSPFETMKAAYFVGRMAVEQGGVHKPGFGLTPGQLWWQHTGGAARALGLGGVVGNLAPGCEADVLVLNPQATPLLARRTQAARSTDELLFALIVLGDDRAVEHVYIA